MHKRDFDGNKYNLGHVIVIFLVHLRLTRASLALCTGSTELQTAPMQKLISIRSRHACGPPGLLIQNPVEAVQLIPSSMSALLGLTHTRCTTDRAQMEWMQSIQRSRSYSDR
jgi:hypothetical protein